MRIGKIQGHICENAKAAVDDTNGMKDQSLDCVLCGAIWGHGRAFCCMLADLGLSLSLSAT